MTSFAIEFLVISATMTSFAMQLTSHTSVEFPFSEIYLHDCEVSKFTSLLESSSNGITGIEQKNASNDLLALF